MRALSISVVFVIVACSGNSVDVGSDSGGSSGSAGTRGGSAGSPTGDDDDVPTGDDAGTTARGGKGAGGTVSGGGPAGGVGAGGVAGSQGASGGTTGVGGSSAGMGGTTIITSCTDEFPFVGEWRGSILDFYFEPMESLVLTVREQSGGAGGFVGELTFGSGDPPPPATDADEPYPPGLDTGSAGAAGGGGRGGGSMPSPGFPYTVVRGAGCDATFRVSISTSQLWESWCPLQTSVYTESSDMWGCTFRGGGASDGTICQIQDNQGNPLAEYPLWKCDLCGWAGGGVCTCDAAGCVASAEPTHVYNLMLTQSGGVDVLSGPDASCPDCTVRLERAE